MADKCTETEDLEVHHIDRSGSAGLDNARVLCNSCHEETPSHGTPGTSPPDFPDETKKQALQRADNQCECIRDNCH